MSSFLGSKSSLPYGAVVARANAARSTVVHTSKQTQTKPDTCTHQTPGHRRQYSPMDTTRTHTNHTHTHAHKRNSGVVRSQKQWEDIAMLDAINRKGPCPGRGAKNNKKLILTTHTHANTLPTAQQAGHKVEWRQQNGGDGKILSPSLLRKPIGKPKQAICNTPVNPNCRSRGTSTKTQDTKYKAQK